MENKKIVEMLNKSFDSGDLLTGGYLDPQRTREFMDLIRGDSTLLSAMRFIPMRRPQMQIDKRHFSEPVTQLADENTASFNAPSIAHSKVLLSTKKFKTFLPITQEYLDNNIEMENAESSIVQAIAQRVSYDLELAALLGDTSISPSLTDPTSTLLRSMDGLDKQTEGAHIVDAGGDRVSKDLFLAMKKRLPKEYKVGPQARRLRWIMSDDVRDEWLSLLGERSTALGDNSIVQKETPPILGYDVLVVPSIPSDKPLSISTGLPAEIFGSRQGPFQFGPTNNQLDLSINGSPTISILFSSGTAPVVLDESSVAKIINDAFVGAGVPAVAFSDSEGRIILRTLQVGVAQSISIQATSTAHITLGLATALPFAVTGVDANTAGNIREGSFIWLTDPRNFMLGMLRKTRMISRYNPEYDRVELFVYSHMDVKVADLHAVVKGINIRVGAI